MARTGDRGALPRCTFCDKSNEQVARLIAGPAGVHICDECVGICTELMEEDRDGPSPAGPSRAPAPREIDDFLGRYVVGQESARRTLAVAVQAALTRILTEPRDAPVEQYRRLFAMDGVELEFTEEAIAAIADQALLRRTGARAVRAILEEVLLDVMYEVPSRDDVARVVVGRDTVLDRVNPTLVPRERRERSA
ncbi:ClpX C4-type zinc finger protein [Streptosporangium sp. NPDC023615]|uniref:ClpX C4-type zinc finger protein n=1 Tax=Streptosporangium sp. NPDC023615 TaxID=3154794 RepID=UPI00341CC97C